MAIFSLICIVIAMVFMNYAIYRGLGLPLTCMIASIFICFTSGINLTEGWDIALETVTPMFGTYVTLYMFGSMLGMLYTESGAAAALGLALIKPFKNVKNPNVKRIGSLFMFFILRVLLALAGLDNMAIMVTMVALVTVLAQELDMPRRYCNAVLMIAGTIQFYMPAVPTMLNVILPRLLDGFTPYSHMIPRICFGVIFIVACVLWLNQMIGKAQSKGEHFVLGGAMNVGDLEDEDVKRPFWLITLIPILSIWAIYNFVGLDAWICMMIGCVIAGVLFIPYIKKDEGKSKFATMVDKCNTSSIRIPLYMALSYAPAAILVTATGYILLLSWMEVLASFIPPALVYSVLIVAVAPLGSAAVQVGANTAINVFIPAGMSVSTCGLLIIISNTVLDTVPNNPGMVMQAELTGVSMKECYPPIFKCTVVVTGCIMAVACIMACIGIL